MMQESKSVLIADDEWHLRLMLATMIKEMGVRVAGEASNGEEAVKRYQALRPDLLLLDINMPVMTGEQVISEIMKEFPDARIVVLTSMADRETVETCLALGATNYILKDCPVDKIREAIVEALSEI